jgi:RNA-directed DNA polymerase
VEDRRAHVDSQQARDWRRKGLPNWRIVRNADDFAVLTDGTAQNLLECVADAAGADLEELGQDVAGAQAALVEDHRQDAFGSGDFLEEHAAAGARKPF